MDTHLGQENRDGQGALTGSGPLSDLSLAAPLPPHRPRCSGFHEDSQSHQYPDSCREQAAIQAAQSGGQRRAGAGAGGIFGTLERELAWLHTGLRTGRWGKDRGGPQATEEGSGNDFPLLSACMHAREEFPKSMGCAPCRKQGQGEREEVWTGATSPLLLDRLTP